MKDVLSGIFAGVVGTAGVVGGCLALLAILAVALLIGAGAVMVGYAWFADHVFMGFVEAGMMVSRLQWADGAVVVIVLAVLNSFSIGGSS